MRFFIILAIFVAISAKIAIFSENAYYLRILYMRACVRARRARAGYLYEN
jgi:hypothetical protein